MSQAGRGGGDDGADRSMVDVGGIHKMEVLKPSGKCSASTRYCWRISPTPANDRSSTITARTAICAEDALRGPKRGRHQCSSRSAWCSERILCSFQENGGDVFQGVKERLRNGKVVCAMPARDYLLYALMDSIVDRYFVILETLGKDRRLQDLC